MSRDLPARPSLDHLRKQAKAVLRSMREHRAEAKLSDAQHAVAREYGFTSWPKLKTHLAALPEGDGAGGGGNGSPPAAGDDGPPPLFPRFTDALRRALFFSRYESFHAGRVRIAPEHLLLGLIRAAGGASRAVLEEAGITLEQARAALIDPDEPREVLVEPIEIPFEPSTKAFFAGAAVEADRLGHARITTIHLLLALAGAEDASARFLRACGITSEKARALAAGWDQE
jgi:hypothetical protein